MQQIAILKHNNLNKPNSIKPKSMVKNFTPRLYQETIFSTACKKNTLVVLPTGMGKTMIFLMLAAHRLKLYPNSKILFIGPTRPLIEQYLNVFKEHFEIPETQMAVFTGHVKPNKREELWKTSKIIFSTPQGLENDIISERINLSEVSLLGVDEAHRAVGDYAYVFVAKQYQKKASYQKIIALTASPGSDLEKISEVCNNLYIEDVEVRTDEDPDVKPYIQEVELKWIKVNLPPIFSEIQKFLNQFINDRLNKLKTMGVLHRPDLKYVNKTDLLSLQGQLRSRISTGDTDFTILSAISITAELMKIYHALELLETQGIVSLQSYLDKLNQEGFAGKTKAIKNLVKDLNFRSAVIKTQKLFDEKVEHPKLVELQKIVEHEVKNDTKIIIFNQYRDNAANIVERLNTIPNIKAKLFVGQNKKANHGLSQKQQKEMMEQFRRSEFNVLVATSVGEEGLDIPKVDIVIFFEPIPSAIRHIQRRGRTGRNEKGKVLILMAKDTRDEGYRWSAHHKEKRMHRILKTLKSRFSSIIEKKEPEPFAKFQVEEEKIKIFADHREKGSGVIKELIDNNASIRLETLKNADYLLSSRVGVEFKNQEDFVNSIIDGRLLQQAKDLKTNFERPLVIVEGTQDIYSIRNIHANAIRGMLATLTISYGIPIIYTKDPKETASILKIIAKKEQEETKKDFSLHGEKRTSTIKDAQEYIVSSFPGVGPSLAKPLLRNFKTIRNIINANSDDLKKVEKIGKKKAEDIKKIVDEEYQD